MAKEYTVKVGNAERLLKYTKAERRALEDRFKIDIKTFLFGRVVPMKDDGITPTGGGFWDAQIAFIYAGVKHGDKRLTEARLEEYVQEHLDGPANEDGDLPNIGDLLKPCLLAALSAGFLGRRIDVEEEAGKVQEPDSTIS